VSSTLVLKASRSFGLGSSNRWATIFSGEVTHVSVVSEYVLESPLLYTLLQLLHRRYAFAHSGLMTPLL
jgi:hypothetical protein